MQNKSCSPEFDVVIVGLGPVGATLANLLGICGVRTLVLEREARTYHLPRAVHFDDECMRVFQTIGLAEDILPHVILSPGMRFVDADGRLILERLEQVIVEGAQEDVLDQHAHGLAAAAVRHVDVGVAHAGAHAALPAVQFRPRAAAMAMPPSKIWR